MRLKISSIVLLSLFLLGTIFARVAQAQAEGGENAPSQSPVQVIVQIIVTAIVLRVLTKFDLP